MPTVQKILDMKGSEVLTVGPDASALDAARLMNEHKVGALVVVQDEQVVGIITERDMLRRVVARRQDPAEADVRHVMTDEIVCGHPGMSIDETRTVFMRRRIRHLPIVNEDRALVGMVSIGDLNAWLLDGQEQELHYLHEYIHGRM